MGNNTNNNSKEQVTTITLPLFKFMNSFDFIWQLLSNHGSTDVKKVACAQLWETFNVQQQRQIYGAIRDKLERGKFVNYDPVKAIQENARRLTPIRLTMREYYQRYGTTAEQDGWKMTNPTGMQVMYVRGNV